MAHVFILRWCPSFSDVNEEVVGQHELLERAIRKKPIPLNMRREGYSIPFGSEFKLLEYRLKEEAIPDFLAKMRCVSFVPMTNKPTLLQILLPRRLKLWFKMNPGMFQKSNVDASIGKKGLIVTYILCKLSALGLWLKPAEAKVETLPDGTRRYANEPYLTKGFCYNFCLGMVPDIKFKVAETEKKGEIYYESL